MSDTQQYEAGHDITTKSRTRSA